MENTEIFSSLIKEVEQCRFLYDVGMVDYNRRDLADVAWKKIGKKLKLQPSDCKERWRNIRSSFIRSLKNKRTGRMYYLSPHLQFLIPFLKHNERKDVSLGLDVEEPGDDILDPEHTGEAGDSLDDGPVEETSRKRKWSQHRALDTEPSGDHINPTIIDTTSTNPNYYFLLSLLPDLDTMTDDQVRTFKIEVMMLVDRIKKNEDTWALKKEY